VTSLLLLGLTDCTMPCTEREWQLERWPLYLLRSDPSNHQLGILLTGQRSGSRMWKGHYPLFGFAHASPTFRRDPRATPSTKAEQMRRCLSLAALRHCNRQRRRGYLCRPHKHFTSNPNEQIISTSWHRIDFILQWPHYLSRRETGVNVKDVKVDMLWARRWTLQLFRVSSWNWVKPSGWTQKECAPADPLFSLYSIPKPGLSAWSSNLIYILVLF
jgi:hypothetical protein